MTWHLRRSLLQCAVAMNERGINQGTSGNISVRSGDGMLITPSGLEYTEINPANIVQVDARGTSRDVGKPSSEWRFHLDIYRHRPDAEASALQTSSAGWNCASSSGSSPSPVL